jgi:DNA primase small subunit
MFDWLSYGNDPDNASGALEYDYFSRREFSFTIEDDIYIRYQSFRDCSELTAAIQKRQPHKIDIGAVFNAPPKSHNTIDPSGFKTVERELVFDIDMTDYDDIRTCCTGANICLRCWPYMTMALKVINIALREDFGFQHILWVYSGRRGVHCWVCDPEARSLSNEARTAVVEYLTVHTGEGAEKKGRGELSFNHPSIQRAYDILDPYFERCIADGSGQGLLETRNKYIKVLNSLPNDKIKKELHDAWESRQIPGAEKWRQIKSALAPPTTAAEITAAKKARVDQAALDNWKLNLVFTHCYPRLDANVSKAQNHLLKSPFCVHPKTGRVCVAIDPATADSFNPFTVPTVRSLCQEVHCSFVLICDIHVSNSRLTIIGTTAMPASLILIKHRCASVCRHLEKAL